MTYKIVKRDGFDAIDPPVSVERFKLLIRSLKKEDEFSALHHGLVHARRKALRKRTGSRSKRAREAHAFRSMMLEFVAKPRVEVMLALMGREVAWSQQGVWRALLDTWNTDCERVLRRWAASRDAVVLREVGVIAAQSGSKRMVSVVQRLMDHTDLRVVRSTIFGARLSRGNASHQYKRTMLRLVTPYIDGSRALKPSDDAWEVVNEALELPRSLFPKQAWSILTSPSVLRPDNPAVADIVWDLCECRDEFPPRSRRPIPAELLWRVFEAARDRKVVELRRRDAESCMGFSLILAAEVDPHRSRHEATSILKSRKPSPLSTPLLRDAAKRALRACQGVPELSEVVARFHRDEKRWKGDALNVLRAHEFAQEVIQDGFDLYFHNTGKHWLAAHRGLVLLKQRRAARLLSQGAKIVFGSQTRRIATNAEAVRAWDSLPDAKRRRVEHMEDEAQTFAPSVFPAAEKYVQAHAKLFR